MSSCDGSKTIEQPMNKWNTLKVAMYGACLGLLYAASLEIGLWTHPDVYGQAGGGLIGGTIAGAILEHFPFAVNRRDSHWAANKILWSSQAEETGNGVFERFTSSSDPGC